MTLKDYANVALFALAVIVCIFTVTYFIFSPWRTNRIGKVYMAKSFFLSMVLVQISWSVITKSDYLAREPIRFTLYGAGFVAYVVMEIVLLREQRNDRIERRRLQAELDEALGDKENETT